MEVRNCRGCGRLFNYIGGPPLCESCREKLEEKFQQVKEYIRDNPGATISMISEENDVTPQQIQQWVREERLEFAEDSPIKLTCENCGAVIRTGRYCENCKRAMANDLNSAFGMNKPKKTEEKKPAQRDKEDRMRFLKS